MSSPSSSLLSRLHISIVWLSPFAGCWLSSRCGPFHCRPGSSPCCPHLVVDSPCSLLTHPFIVLPRSLPFPPREQLFAAIGGDDGGGGPWPSPPHRHRCLIPIISSSPSPSSIPPVVPISTHNPSSEQWLVGMGVGAGPMFRIGGRRRVSVTWHREGGWLVLT